MTPAPFGLHLDTGRPILRLDCDKVGSGIQFTTMGADDEMANTMFVLEVDGDREMTRRPEPLLVTYLDMMVMAKEYIVQLSDGTTTDVELTEKERRGIKRTRAEVRDGLANSPLGEP